MDESKLNKTRMLKVFIEVKKLEENLDQLISKLANLRQTIHSSIINWVLKLPKTKPERFDKKRR